MLLYNWYYNANRNNVRIFMPKFKNVGPIHKKNIADLPDNYMIFDLDIVPGIHAESNVNILSTRERCDLTSIRLSICFLMISGSG